MGYEDVSHRSADAIWIEAAAELGVPVARGGDAYVHWDGAVLHIARDEALDEDDTLAQLVFHELCHFLTEGLPARALPDWGLDNTSARDEAREWACLRLQARLLGPHGLRDILVPTTPEGRAFYRTLPSDPLLPIDHPEVRVALRAARLAAAPPFGPVLRRALAETARQARLPLHPKTGFPLGHPASRCGSCVWRTTGGRCRQSARPVRVESDARACARFEHALDCLACGACCREAYDSVTVSRRDPIVKLHPHLIADRGSYLEVRREEGRCGALDGETFTCAVYAERPRVCRAFEVGGRHCLDARRRVGVSL